MHPQLLWWATVWRAASQAIVSHQVVGRRHGARTQQGWHMRAAECTAFVSCTACCNMTYIIVRTPVELDWRSAAEHAAHTAIGSLRLGCTDASCTVLSIQTRAAW